MNKEIYSINEPIVNSIIKIGNNFNIYTDKKFNWFQRKMIKFYFGFEVINND